MKVVINSNLLYKKLQKVLDLEPEPRTVYVNEGNLKFIGEKVIAIECTGKVGGEEKFRWTTWDKVSEILKKMPEQPIVLTINSEKEIEINCVIVIK
jgi:hypothetical protein